MRRKAAARRAAHHATGRKTQEAAQPCKHTVRDYHFEKPDSTWKRSRGVAGTVAVGKSVTC